jgi:CheY-like chemotaxis protein
MGDEFRKENRQLFTSVLTKPIKQHVLCKHVINGLEHQEKVSSAETTVHEKLPRDFSEKYPLDILIAEDNMFNQQVIFHILHKMGYQPRIVENGEMAVAATREADYDVILMDMQMPEMDGIEATRIIRQTLAEQPVIIALTANSMQGDEEKCRSRVRQPAVRRCHHRERRPRRRECRPQRGSVLGIARRRWELRHRHLVRVRTPPGRSRGLRGDRRVARRTS